MPVLLPNIDPKAVLRWTAGVTSVCLFCSAAAAQMPTEGGFNHAPDLWLVNPGQPWHHSVQGAAQPAELRRREPEPAERAVVANAKMMFANSSAKAMALVKGRDVIWMDVKPPVTPESLINGFSMGKTVTAMAVGKAICAGRLTLRTQAMEPVQELQDKDLGRATVADLLTMRSGAWEGNPDSTIWTAQEVQALAAGQISWLELLASPRVSAAATGFFGTRRKPGETFSYHSTDPLLLGVMLARSTGKSYAQWTAQEVLLPARIEGPAAIAQDKAAGYGNADGGVRMKLADWVRYAVWQRESEAAEGCFGQFVRDAVRGHTPSHRTGSVPSSYGYLNWVQGDINWAIGYGGQRIGWNRRNDRILVAFSSVENYMTELHELYGAWAALP